MSDTQAVLDGLTVEELQSARARLYRAKITGTLSTQLPDGTRVQYRTLAEMDAALLDLDKRLWAAMSGPVVDPMMQPVRVFRVRPWNGAR